MELQNSLEEIKQILLPHTQKAYLVGGTLRDILTQKTPKDLDIEVYDIAPEKFATLAKTWGALGVGKSFFVYKYKDIDLSLPRIEKRVGLKHTDFEVSYCIDAKEASRRRDFAMNALMVDIFSGEVFDFWGGMEDIKQRRIRLIDEQKFQEDELRVLRAARFASQLGFVIEKRTLEVMQGMGLENVSKERIFWELNKIFVSSFPEIGFMYLYKLGFFKEFFAVDMNFEKAYKIAVRLREFYAYRSEKMSRFIFLYVLFGELALDAKESLKKLHAPREFFNALAHAPYKLAPLSDEELLMLSLDKPLCEWVGICQKGLEKRAKELDVYNKKVSLSISAKDVMRDGFEGKQIGNELRKRQLKLIKEKVNG